MVIDQDKAERTIKYDWPISPIGSCASSLERNSDRNGAVIVANHTSLCIINYLFDL